ncbi:MAG: VOC family protein [Gammaproteobacteria bacterium]
MTEKKMQYGEFCWYELMTNEPEKAQEFYGSLLGWHFMEHDFGGTKYTSIKAGEKEMGGIMQIPQDKKDRIPTHWLNYIHVENLDTTLTKAKSLGATVCVEATPVSDFGRFAVIIDPTGASIALWQTLKNCD